jgi:uncharacterized OsmC-like protein
MIRTGRGHCERGQSVLTSTVCPEFAVKITLLSEHSIRLEPIPGPMTIEALTAEQSYSPFHVMASGLAYCTWSVLYAWAEHAELNAEDLTLDVGWTFADDPHRVDHYDLRFNWPSLPTKRLEAAKRVAQLCTIHATFEHPPTIEIGGTATPAPATSDVPPDAVESMAR